MNTFKLNLVTPDKNVFDGEITKLTCKNSVGEFQILANFAPFITTTKPTITVIEDAEGKTHEIFTSTGIMNVKENTLSFCVDAGEWPEDIDSERALQAKKRAEERLANRDKNLDVKRAQLALSRAMIRLQLNK